MLSIAGVVLAQMLSSTPEITAAPLASDWQQARIQQVLKARKVMGKGHGSDSRKVSGKQSPTETPPVPSDAPRPESKESHTG